jgi:hypothetical protein
MHLVQHHVLQFLIIDRAKVGIHLVRLPSNPAGQHVFSTVIEAILDEKPGHVLNLRSPEASLHHEGISDPDRNQAS